MASRVTVLPFITDEINLAKRSTPTYLGLVLLKAARVETGIL
jgi:hypothetical protein